MGPLLRMQTRLHFEDLPENVQVQYLQKIALRAENKRVHRLVTTSSLASSKAFFYLLIDILKFSNS
jgi:hypothetical protein